MPFVVQPLQQAFEAIGERTLEAAATLRASPWDRFASVALPLARPGLVTASVLGFAHTVGEFGVVLMIGGNIPDKTRVLSVAIYDHVEASEFADAHRLSAGMVAFALVVLVTLYAVNRPRRDRRCQYYRSTPASASEAAQREASADGEMRSILTVRCKQWLGLISKTRRKNGEPR